MKKTFLTVFAFCTLLTAALAQDITLPQPKKTGGMPLMEALNKRQSTRTFSEAALSNQTVANLLWAAWGYNRPEENKRTAPSGMNKQEIDLYVVFPTGAYLWDAKANKLIQVTKADLRKSASGGQTFAETAPVTIIFVADKNKSDGAMTAAYISQNIYLFCASESLATVARGGFNSDELSKALNLKENQKTVLVQPVGRVKK
ncbi:MAG: SagB/ThcOx family dehydrogenase [Prevotellaceae bacterium]|jgi:nitroreductase|nr:SagB/ThcOx family dehydrogenase [Prevotellaceae bacterium]